MIRLVELPSPTVTAPALHPAHLEDLRKSGLTEDDARTAGVYTARPGDLNRLTERNLPDNGISGMVFPYHHPDGFTRVKLFPPLVEPDGTVRRYLQRKGTGCRLYVPPRVAPLLTDVAHPLAIVEGEKKTLAVCKAGWPAVGIGGIWNFATDGALIPDLKAIALNGRILRIIPDAETWLREDLLPAVFRLGRLLEADGATVFFVKLPVLSGEKTGADDFIVIKGRDAFSRLVKRAVTLEDSSFRALRVQEKREAREAAKPGSLPPELAGRRIHPGLQMEENFASLGIVAVGSDGRPTTQVITSDRKTYPAEVLGQVATTRPLAYAPLVDRWPAEGREAWLKGKTAPASFALATGAVLALFGKLLDAPFPTLAILTCWTVATYFHRLFPAFARLFLTGESESGKSKAQQICAGVTWNGMYRVTPNGPPLYRLIEALRPAYCISEAEHLDGEQRQVLEAVINEGYLRGGYVDRCDKESNWEPRPFEVYAPVSLGNIKGLKRVMENRTITVVMIQGTDRSKVNADVDVEAETFRAVRSLLHQLALERFREVLHAWRTLPDPPWLVARARQLWKPLLVLASLADREAGRTLNLTETIRQAAQKQTRDRAQPSDEVAALVAVLKPRLQGVREVLLHPGDLVDDLKLRLHRDHVTAAWVGHLMRRNGFEKPEPPRDRDADGVFYRITWERIEAIQARYADPHEQPTDLHTSETYTPQPLELPGVSASNVGM